MKITTVVGGVHFVPLLFKDVRQIRGSRAFLAGAGVTCYLPGLVEFICQIIDHLRDRVPAGLKLFWCKEVLHYRVSLQNACDKKLIHANPYMFCRPLLPMIKKYILLT